MCTDFPIISTGHPIVLRVKVGKLGSVKPSRKTLVIKSALRDPVTNLRLERLLQNPEVEAVRKLQCISKLHVHVPKIQTIFPAASTKTRDGPGALSTYVNCFELLSGKRLFMIGLDLVI